VLSGPSILTEVESDTLIKVILYGTGEVYRVIELETWSLLHVWYLSVKRMTRTTYSRLCGSPNLTQDGDCWVCVSNRVLHQI